MVSVASLLNPIPPSFEMYRDSPSPVSRESTPAYAPAYLPASPPPLPAPKKLKMSKAAAVFVKGKPKGEIRYTPCEIQDETIAAEHKKFEVEPIGRIGHYPRHIPYNSEKKSFQQKTGRDAFEAFQYTFRMPDDDRDKDAHAVMWDYNVGLVRITSFFKSLKHSKTMPAKVMNANPGLREISHSITGGSIGAQGYWVPFEAAKAVAATFCWEIRYVLTPVFGLDFPAICTDPGDPAFLRISIDRSIISRCTEAAIASRVQSQESSLASSPRTPYSLTSAPNWTPKVLRPKLREIANSESGYGTDTERSPSYLSSPVAGDIRWTPVNSPRATNLDRFRLPSPPTSTSSPDKGTSPHTSSGKGNHHSKRRRPDKCKDSEEGSSLGQSSNDVPEVPKRRKISATLTQEARAAYMLMQLHMADATLGARRSPNHRRASH